jgi:ATP-dependent helicase/nuclease subunit B
LKSNAAIFDAVARFSGDGVTVVTPNRRLAATLKRVFDDAQIAANQRAWASPDIVPLATFFERTFQQRSRQHADTPLLISSSHAQILWERIIRESENAESLALLSVAQAAKDASAAYSLMHAWDLSAAIGRFALSGTLNDDCRAFWTWAQRYRDLMAEKNWLDSAVLPNYLYEKLSHESNMVMPRKIIMAGFDIVTPQQQAFFAACRARGVIVEELEGNATNSVEANHVTRHECLTDEDELRAAAEWARTRLTVNRDQHIAIVVPDLRAKRSQVSRIMIDTLSPNARATGQGSANTAFNISLGVALTDYALVGEALDLLEFSIVRSMPTLRLSAILRSPFVAGSTYEYASRAKLDAVFREVLGVEASLFSIQKINRTTADSKLKRAIDACPIWCETIDRVAQCNAPQIGKRDQRDKAKEATPHDWCDYFSRLLAAWGFPGEAAMDSTQFQVLQKFRDVLATLATLQTVEPRLHIHDALRHIRRIATETIFQPESGDAEAPIQVLGILESAGQLPHAIDALWVAGLNDQAWPLPARPNPFIPFVLQREAGVPEASANASFALDARITQGWLSSAATVVVSHATHESSDAALAPRNVSSLIATIALTAPPTFDANIAEAMLANSTRLEPIVDAPFVPLPVPTAVAGGATLMADVAACPFRAFARHRLRATPLAQPQRGLDAAERGTLLHAVLNHVWVQLVSQAALLEMPPDQLDKLIADCVERAVNDARAAGTDILDGRFGEIEQARLVRVVNDWLEIERARTPFKVVATEAAREISVAGLKMKLRLDRMDQLQDGTHALIDYKTGVADYRNWLGARPDEPQLPLYYRAVEANGDIVSTLAYARLKRGKAFGFDGVSAVADVLPKVTPIEDKYGRDAGAYASWDVLVQSWETSLDGLATQFVNGDAMVEPKNGALTCARCDLQTVCRVSSLNKPLSAENDDA